MKIFTLIFAMMMALPVLARHEGEISIQSRTGERFYVVLNGLYQNHEARSHVRFSAFQNEWNNCQVVGDNQHFLIDNRIMVKRNKRINYEVVERYGRYSLRYISEEFIGHPNYNDGYGMNGNSGYYGNNCPNTPPPSSCGTTRPYTYTNSCSSNGNNFNANYRPIMDQNSFARLKNAVDKECFSDDKLRVASHAARNKRMSVSQIKEIVQMFTFSDERLEFAKRAYNNCVNPSDYYEVMEVFTFSSDKRKLEQYIMQH